MFMVVFMGDDAVFVIVLGKHGKKIKRGNMYHFGNFKIVVFGGGVILKLRVRTF